MAKHCLQCNRTFSKAEHLKRHERRHTNERPYKCPICQKSFSRSDVLFRHVKCHREQGANVADVQNEDASGEVAQGSSSCQHAYPENAASLERSEPPLEGMDSIVVAQPMKCGGVAGSNHEPHRLSSNIQLSPSQTLNHQQQDSTVAINGPDNSCHFMSSDDASQRQVLARPACNTDSIMNPLQASQSIAQHEQSVIHQGQAPLTPSQPSPLQSQQQVAFADMWDLSSRHTFQDFVDFPFPFPMSMDNHATLPQSWLFDPGTSTSSILDNQHQSPPHPVNQAPITWASVAQQTHFAPFNEQRPASTDANFPKNMDEVERYWPSGSIATPQSAARLFQSVLDSNADNLFCIASQNEQTTGQCPTRVLSGHWGFDQSCWLRINDLLYAGRFPNATSQAEPPDSSIDTQSTSEVYNTTSISLPPLDIFETILDIFFWQFLPMAPFIHIPTFSAKRCPTILLSVIVTLGFSMIKTKGAHQFVAQTFKQLMHTVQEDLQVSMRFEKDPAKCLASIASALLVLHLTCLLGDRWRIDQAEPLYISTLSFAQRLGLFTMPEKNCSETVFSRYSSIEQRWTAWCKIESLNRLIVSLIEMDCWYASHLSIIPVLRVENLRTMLPSRSDLFQASSASYWEQYLNGVTAYQMPLATPYSNLASIALSDEITFFTYLNMLHLRLRHAQSRLQTLVETSRKVLPWHIYHQNPWECSLMPLLTGVPKFRSRGMADADLNSALLWNSMCVNLCIDQRILEEASGRFGKNFIDQGMDRIRDWTKTPTARRAVLHAGETYRLLFHRRVSDIIKPYGLNAAFISALTLGFYLHCASKDSTSSVSIEIFKEVDWCIIGDRGLAELESSPQSDAQVHGNGDAAKEFIDAGGSFTLHGRVFNLGRSSARRSLLHFADLIESIWKRKGAMYSRILYFLSSNLPELVHDQRPDSDRGDDATNVQ